MLALLRGFCMSIFVYTAASAACVSVRAVRVEEIVEHECSNNSEDEGDR